MSQEAELYDGTVLEFPDGTKPEIIQQTAKRMTVERQKASPTAGFNVDDMGNVTDTTGKNILDQSKGGLSKYNGLLGGENAQIKSAPGFLTNLSQALTAPFHQERAPVAADQPRPGIVGRALESAAGIGKGVLGLLNAPFETIAPTVTKYAGENLPIEPRTAEAIGNAAGVVAQGSILPWRSRTPLAPARNIEDLIAAPRPGLPAPPEQLRLPPAAQPRLNPPEMVTQVTPEGVASQAPKRTIIDLVDEVKRDVKQQVIDEIFQEMKTGRPQAAAAAPKQAAPLSIEDLRGQLAPEARATTPAAEAKAPMEVPSMVKEATPPTPTAEQPIFTSAKEPPEVSAATVAELKRGLAEETPKGVPPGPLTGEQRAMQQRAEVQAKPTETAPTVEKTNLIKLPDGREFPSYNGEALSWNIDGAATHADELAGYPKTRAVIQAMRESRPDELVQKHAELVKGSFDRTFGGNAKKLLKVVEEEVPELKPAVKKATPTPTPASQPDETPPIFKDYPQFQPKKTPSVQDRIAQLEAENAAMREKQPKTFDMPSLKERAEQQYAGWKGYPKREEPLPGERTAGDILKGESGALKIGRDKPPEVFGPPIEPPEVRGGIQSPKFDFSKWKDKPALSLSRETLERNITKVAPAEDAAKVDNFIVQPVRQNETNRINYNNALKTETRGSVVEKLGIKAGSKEDALTQAYGEGRLPLDELKTLTPNWQKVVSASDYFRGKYDKLLDTVNEARAKFGYEPIPKRADYFRHFQDIDNIIKNFGVILRTEDLPTEISGLTEGFKPGKPFSTAELQRKGGSYTMSAIKGFDNYIDSISKQIFHIDSVQRARGLENYIRQAAGAENAKLPNLVANLHEYGNLLAGKKSTFDRAFESLFGRKFYAAVNVLRGRTSANMVGGNVGSALTNFIPFTQAAATTEKGSLAKGMLQATVAPFEKDPAAIDGIASSFLTRRYPEGAISPTIGDKLKGGANFLFDAVDKFTARSVVGGKYYEGIKNGLSPKEAMAAADTYAGKVLTDRSLGQLPNLFNVKTLGPITQFQTEINNAYSFMTKDIPALSGSKAKTVKALSEFVLYSYLFNSGFEQVTGRRPTIDPLHFLITLAGDGDIKQKLGTLNEDIVSNLPLVGGISGGRLPISAGMPDVLGMIKGEKGVGAELSKPAFFLAPPFGGLQAKKTIEGASAYDAGQVRSASGNKKLFDIEQSPENLVRSVLFGKYASPQAREYFDSGQLTPRQKMLKQLGLKDMSKDRDEKRKEMLNKLGLNR